jgi:hypothetical protein
LAIDISGDSALFTSFNNHIADLGAAMQATAALAPTIGNVAGQGVSTFGSVTAAGAACFTSQASTVLNIQASISVSVSASATVQGQG